ncbi:uncharacterized protein MONOS_7796 [Monocercomonoides exilis]|uniref:uncharacterized protein n=1 Tax=Monocercomonoides exilis TaxID=2049356 RepID=UPI0035599A4A|nr:hypothetical protein MONOS_7796 [Monocercomonoides exilis]|eukprot:MONOS_7796.1-p1 / transcript=MONOS_7796.1 / gene=MONOS_7796 / organism=Monocercomonoides_exilis_PA203 / gene_product=unspecified product / transcript_product=unspecified product / location=Mono_scaffold00276:25368-27022(-) / protein_length=381 / sequence_SO=supercontig / SO=protein_coding / is_pseudo=false
MTQDPVRMENSDSEDRGFDLAHRLSRVENMIEEMARSRAVPSRSGVMGMLTMKKVKRERQRKRSQSRSSESESVSDFTDTITKRKQRKRLRSGRTRELMRRWDEEGSSDSDSGSTEKREEKQERSDDILGIFPDGRKDSAEAARVIELLQPSLKSGQGRAPRKVQHRQKRSRLCLQTIPKARFRWEFCKFQTKKEVNTNSTTTGPSNSWESSLVHSPPSSSSPEDTGRISSRNIYWNEPVGLEISALCRETEREERAALCSETGTDMMLSEPKGMTVLREVPINRQTVTGEEPLEVCENNEEVLSPFDREKRINQGISRDHEMGTWRENTEEDSVYPHGTKQKNDQESLKEGVKIVWRASGTVIESLIESDLEVSSKTAI